MKILAINGSPRKNKNTATLLQNALNGAAAQGAETELIHLFDLDYKGCMSCFACKLKDGPSYGKCAYNDGLLPVLEKIQTVDALVLGSPMYFDSITGYMRAFLERLMFPILTYTEGYKGLLEKKVPVGFIYTMNVTQDYMIEAGYLHGLQVVERYLQKLFGYSESMAAYDTYQFNDYSKYVATAFDEKAKAKVKAEQFPIDCKNAFELGARLTQNI